MLVKMKEPVASWQRRKFERVVFLVDVKVLTEQDDRRNCAAQIFSSVVTILEKCNGLSRFSTLWGYVFFDSSRSPMASNTFIGKLVAGEPTRELFDTSKNLEKFGKVLEAVVASGDGYTSAGKSRADCLLRNLAAVASDFQWDPLLKSDSSDEDMRRCLHHQTSEAVDLQSTEPESNLVILFSRLPDSSTQLARFLDFRASPSDSAFEEKLLFEFVSRFKSIQSVLDSKNINCCWIDVPARQSFGNSGLYEAYVKPTTDQSVARRCLFETAWNYVSLSLVANIMDLVPLRLIWNVIAHLTPKFLGRRIIAGCEACVRCPEARLPRNYKDQTTSFAVGVQLWSSTVLSSSRSGHISTLSRSFGKGTLGLPLISSSRVEIVILSKQSRRNTFELSTERYLVLQKPSQVFRSCTETEKKRKLEDRRSGELNAGEPSWPGLLITLEREECVALVTVKGGGCNCQATLEPFTPNSALLTVIHISGSALVRNIPSHLSCHTSKVSMICLKKKLDDAEGTSSLPIMGYGRNIGAAGVETGDVSEFERSFDSTLLKIVKEKRRGCVLFKSVKKHIAEHRKTLDSTHELFQGSTSEPEKVSWEEYWRRVIKRLQQQHLVVNNNCSISSSLGVMKAPIDLLSVEQFLQNMVRFQVSGTLLEGPEPVPDLDLLGSQLRSPVRHVPNRSCSLVTTSPQRVGGDLQLSPTVSLYPPCHPYPPFSAYPYTFQSRSPGTEDGVQARESVPLTPPPELPVVCTAISEAKSRQTINLVGRPSEAEMNDVGNSETASGYFSIKELTRSVLTSGVVDLHQFARSVVSEAYRKFRLGEDKEMIAEGTLVSEAASSQYSDASVAFLMKQLLKRPKHLVSKYKELLASGATAITSKASVVAEKLREHELQILFRLEFLAFQGEFDKARQEALTRDICQLLDNIQFHLVGRNWSAESLQQYCDRVIVSRYKGLLPSTISRIFAAMELNGYCDPLASSSVYVESLQSSEVQPSSDDVVSLSEYEATEPSFNAPFNSPGQLKCLLLNTRRLSDCKSGLVNEVVTSHTKDTSGKENLGFYSAVQDVPHEEKKHRKIYHFSSGTQNLLRVKTVKPRDHVATRPRRITRLPRSSAARTVDHYTKVQITDNTRIPALPLQRRLLQNRENDFHVVCQTPSVKSRGL